MTPRQAVRMAEPKAMVDYYETLKSAGKPCYFVRANIQGPALSDICASPRAAWKNAFDGLTASFLRKKVGA